MKTIKEILPLASFLRPKSVNQIKGNSRLLSDNGLIASMIKNNAFMSTIFWGPPGTGKTTIASIIGSSANFNYITLNATKHKVKDIHDSAVQAQTVCEEKGLKTIVFLDEIHRFSKSQQDILLPYIEKGDFILIGATTENPSFYIISPLLSRCTVLKFSPLSSNDIFEILTNATQIIKKETGVEVEDEIITQICQYNLSDARKAIELLEIALINGAKSKEELSSLMEILPYYSKTGDDHYDYISAIHKSVRSSDVDAALFWISRMLVSGEEPLYILRRLIRIAIEDIGMADPFAINIVKDCRDVYEFLGSPEGDIAIYHAAIYLSLAPKSNSIEKAMAKSQDLAKQFGYAAVPMHLRNAPTKLMKNMGYAQDYKYDHDFPNAITDQKCLPKELYKMSIYSPNEVGFEKKLAERIKIISKIKGYEKS